MWLPSFVKYVNFYLAENLETISSDDCSQEMAQQYCHRNLLIHLLYRLQIGSYSGTAGDGMTFHNKMYFTTFDRDNDEYSGGIDAVLYRGAWWYKSGYRAELNTEWAVTGTKRDAWNDGKKTWKISFAEMKIRRIKVT
ncbi:fibrinogen-related protein 2.1 [Plakobranchus ocellatus]|uniref:Fibrinogen-related protein 2.1 n=1 Tax=Plakobranchus ocellatus TaxID=259542 RepID=A0AAV4AKE1_9GAST|nr:fibrinogen-related protein 2.1 [Plakobranchus ocellatus]